MPTKLGAFAARVGEAGWLAALVIVPLLFNVYTERVFEEDKIPLMRSIALLVALALVVWLVERGAEALRPRGEPLWKVPVVLPALALTGSYLLATAFSIVPHISFWGAYIRRQGTFTWLSYVIFFFAILLLVRERRQADRVVTLLLFASVPASLYAFLQRLGVDPLPWGGDVMTRVSSVAGNPIFIAAYLIMVVPLTVMRLSEHFAELLRRDPDDAQPTPVVASSLLAGAYLFLLLLQGATILFSLSRGPWIGLAVGMIFFLVLATMRRVRWMPLAISALVVGGILFVLTLNVPGGPLEPLREVRYVDRLATIFSVESRTGRVRSLIWEGATDLLAANPARDIVGYGPEAMYVAFNPYYPPELGQIEARNASPDRSHNETFDSLVMTGVLGFLAQLALFLSLFYYALRWLGLIRTPFQRTLFWGGALLSGAAGWFVPYALNGSFQYSGVGLPAALTGWLLAYLLGFTVTHMQDDGVADSPHALLLIALLSGVIAHFVEMHFGIAIGVTRLYFWLYAGLIVAVGFPLLHAEAEAEPAAAPSRRRRGAARTAAAEPTLWSGTLLGLSLMAGLILIVLSFNFLTPTLAVDRYVVWLFAGTWLFGALTVTAESVAEQQRREGAVAQQWLQRLGIYALVSLATWLLFLLFYLPWVRTRPISGNISADELLAYGYHLANTVSLLYVAALLIVGVGAWLLGREERSAPQWLRAPGWQGLLYGVGLMALWPMVLNANLNISRADTLNKQGAGYERAQQWPAAQLFYQEALRLQPNEDRYFLSLGRTLLEQGRRQSDDPVQRDRFLQEARAVLERARATNPLNTDHSRNLASLHRAWAVLTEDANERAEHRATAARFYERALALSPNNASLWNEWATLGLEESDFATARAKLDRSLALDRTYVETWILYAATALQEAESAPARSAALREEALSHYEEALTLEPTHATALRNRAVLLTQLGREAEAEASYRAALAINPNDYATLKNLALLYQQMEAFEQAIEVAQQALPLAPEAEQAAMQNFIRDLQQRLAELSGG